MLLAVVVESRSSFVVFIYFIYDYRFEVIQSISQIITTNLAPPNPKPYLLEEQGEVSVLRN